ncbi:O-methyltransferase [Alkalihalobacillus sp. AL-G]|uniref:O-methyltransferase n=1 Tax=Alkalihalobacillus sp. AL-G TaxID=2926399 RepID=UPI00272C0599|nr:O-methyltransferase [Alkalihalobacillus sp. AL-G]WLD94830.1 O-methyltransferase [Alkalihalobacillus sp. AL-G]
MDLEQYIQTVFVKEDDQYAKITNALEEIGMPTISVAPETGKLLTLLVKMSGAEKLLEIGALGGYSGICLLRGAGIKGRLTSLELIQSYADVAQQHVNEADFNEQVSYKIGPALTSLNELVANNESFDFFFIDADKENYVNYLELCVQLSNPGAIITGDNTLWGGRVIDASAQDVDTKALRAFNEAVANHPRLEGLILPIGDGLTIARVVD